MEHGSPASLEVGSASRTPLTVEKQQQQHHLALLPGRTGGREGRPGAAFGMPYIQVGRSDEVEHCVSASSNHLNERAEERKEERQQSVGAAAESTTPVVQTQPPTAPPAAAAAAAGPAAESGEKEDTDGVEVKKQTSMIQAERTDDATWDAKKAETVRGCCAGFFSRRRYRANQAPS